MTQGPHDHDRRQASDSARRSSSPGAPASGVRPPRVTWPATGPSGELSKHGARLLRKRLAQYVESSPLAFVAWDGQARASHWSARAVELFGWSASEVAGLTPRQIGLVHEADLEQMELEIARIMGGEARRSTLSLRGRRRRGKAFYSRWYLSGIYDDEGRFVSLFSQVDDVTDHRMVEERYQTLFQQSKDAIFLVNGPAFVDCNETTLSMFGCDYDDIIGQPPYDFSPPHQRDGSDSRALALEKITAAYAGVPQRFEWLHCRLDGSFFDAEVSLSRLQLPEGTMLLAIVRDITERRAREMELRRYRDDLRDFAARLGRAGDLERRKLAADLHDCAGQNLSAALLRMRQAQAHATDPKQRELLQVAHELVEQTSTQLRSMSLELAPPVLHEVGLEAALEVIARRLEDERGLPCRMVAEQPLDPLPLEVRTTLYRCVGELLTNVVKHANASSVEITWQRDGDETTLWIVDDGRGIDAAQNHPDGQAPGGFGLFSVRERMRSIGGTMEIESRRGKGTSVALSWGSAKSA